MADVIAFPVPVCRCALLHVWQAGDGWELHHESRHGDSWALLDRFDTHEAAEAAALEALPHYPGAMLVGVTE
jgi:hypothetical protein